MRKSIAVFLLAEFVASASYARASVMTFDASGTWTDGSSLTDTVMIDTATGAVSAVDLTILGTPIGPVVFDSGAPDNFLQGATLIAPQDIRIVDDILPSNPHNASVVYLDIALPPSVTTLENYGGGPLGSLVNVIPGGGNSGYEVIVNETFVADGTLQSGALAVSTPEPSSVILAAFGLLGLLAPGAGSHRAP